MVLKSKYFDPKSFGRTMIILCFLYILDIIGNVFLQFIDWGSPNVYTFYRIPQSQTVTIMNIGLVVIQFGIQIFMLVIALSLFWRTFLFKYGFIGVLCRNFKFSFFLMVLYPTFFGIERIFRYYYLNRTPNWQYNELTAYKDGDYLGIYIVKYIIGFTYYIVMINTCYELGKSKYYKSDLWFAANMVA